MASTTRRNWQAPLASTDRDVSIETQQSLEQGTHVSWGGIWAGVLVAMGTLLLLSTLGLAVGIAANTAAGGGVAAGAGNVNPGTMGTAAVIWSALSLLISMFLGGLAATRMGRIWDRGAGMFHGGLVWVITLGTILYLAARGLGGLMGTHGGGVGVGFDTGAGGGMAGGAAGTGAGAAANAAAGHETTIGWSPFIISALSLLAALAGAASGLRRMLDLGRQSGSNSSYGGSSTNYGSSGTTTSSDTPPGSPGTTTTTTTTRDRDRDRY